MKTDYYTELTNETLKELKNFANWMNKNFGHYPLIIGGWAVWTYKQKLKKFMKKSNITNHLQKFLSELNDKKDILDEFKTNIKEIKKQLHYDINSYLLIA